MILPTSRFSIIKFSLLTILLSKDVFVLIFSTKASCGPLITISLSGVSTLLCLKPFTSISKAIFKVSINKAQFPAFTPFATSSKSDICSTLFWGSKQPK